MNTGTLGTQVENFLLNAGDDHTLAGHSAPQNYSAGVTLTVLGHAGTSFSVTSGDSQTVIVGASGIIAGLSLANGTTGQTGLAALDVNSIGSGLSGSTGPVLVASGGAAVHGGLEHRRAGRARPELLAQRGRRPHASRPFGPSGLLRRRDVDRAGPRRPGLNVTSGDSQTVIIGASGVTAGLSLANGTTGQGGLAALDVNSLGTGLNGSTGDKLVPLRRGAAVHGAARRQPFGDAR